MKQGLTEKQYEMLNWIRKFIQDNGWSPSTEQIANAMEVSQSSAGDMINRIVERGHLSKDGPRTLTVID